MPGRAVSEELQLRDNRWGRATEEARLHPMGLLIYHAFPRLYSGICAEILDNALLKWVTGPIGLRLNVYLRSDVSKITTRNQDIQFFPPHAVSYIYYITFLEAVQLLALVLPSRHVASFPSFFDQQAGRLGAGHDLDNSTRRDH